MLFVYWVDFWTKIVDFLSGTYFNLLLILHEASSHDLRRDGAVC